MTSRDLEKAAEELRKYREMKSQSQGALDAQMKRLKEEFDVDSIKEGQEKVKRINQEIAELDAELERELKELGAIDENG